MAERHHKVKDAAERDEKGNKKLKGGTIKEMEQKFIYCDAENCTYYHPLFFDTKLKQWVMPDGHYCQNSEWHPHEDNHDTDMLVQKPSATPEGKDLREAFGNASPQLSEDEQREATTAH